MSEYTESTTEITRREELLLALADVGFDKEKVEVHDEPVHLRGYENDIRTDLAHVIIRRKHVGKLSNDIGFLFENGTCKAIISQYDSNKYNDTWLNQVKQRYSVHVVKAKAKAKGFRVAERHLADGTVQLLAQRSKLVGKKVR